MAERIGIESINVRCDINLELIELPYVRPLPKKEYLVLHISLLLHDIIPVRIITHSNNVNLYIFTFEIIHNAQRYDNVINWHVYTFN